MESMYGDIRKLAEILKPAGEDSDSEDDLPQCGLSKLGPGDIGPNKYQNNTTGTDDTVSTKDISDEAAIWDEREVPNITVSDETSDPRERPEFDIKYRQAVTPEDVYLQMGGRTPGTASCEDMVVSVKLEGEKKDDVNLAVTKQKMDIWSPRYRLSLPLPHPVDPDSSRAEWQCSSKEAATLVIILRMQREFDFVNF